MDYLWHRYSPELFDVEAGLSCSRSPPWADPADQITWNMVHFYLVFV